MCDHKCNYYYTLNGGGGGYSFLMCMERRLSRKDQVETLNSVIIY